MKRLILEGRSIRDIPTFYDELNRVFMAGEDWSLGPSLDAIDDMLRGGYGAIDGREPVELVWRDIAGSEAALGPDATIALLRAKLAQPERYNAALIGEQLAALERGKGRTYFDIVLEIIADHPNIRLVRS